MSAQVFILRRQGGEDGPYREEEVLDALEAGDLSPLDWCRLENQAHAQRLCEVFERVVAGQELDVDSDEEPERGVVETKEAEGADGRADEEQVREEEQGQEEEEVREGEEMLYDGSPSVLGYGWTWAVVAGALAAGYWLGQFGLGWVLGSLGLAFLLVGRLLLHRAAREYVVTTDRVVATVGMLGGRTREIRLRDLESIRLHCPWSLGWLGVGTVIFSGAGGPGEEVIFERVGRVQRVIGLVRDARRRHAGG